MVMSKNILTYFKPNMVKIQFLILRGSLESNTDAHFLELDTLSAGT